MSITTCGHAGYCVMCEVDNVNQVLNDDGPTPLEAGIGGLAIAFSFWASIALFGAIAALVQRYNAVTASLVIALVSGFGIGMWSRLYGRRR